MLFKSFVLATIAGCALSQPLQHQHHEHKVDKRAVVTQIKNIVVTVGAGDGTATLSSVSLSEATTASVSSFTHVPQNAPTSSVEGSASSEAASSAESSASIPSSIPSGGAGGAKGITYTPYANDGSCKSSSQIQSEVAELSGFDVLRLYGVDCDQVAQVLKAKSSSQKIFAGIYDVDNIKDGVSTLASAVKDNGDWDDIYTVSIGNELVNAGSATPSQIGEYVKSGKSALKAAGYSGPVVSVDTFIAVINNPDLCDHSDYMAVNAHAFFDGHISAGDAGDWVLLQIQRVYDACGGKKSVFITETGWPSKGESNGVAVPSKENQESAVSSIKLSCGNDVTLFTAFNDLWKADGPYSAEKYWGIYSS